jgi:complex iron-sulfur molybdoenzyme family reductase subunit alpha
MSYNRRDALRGLLAMGAAGMLKGRQAQAKAATPDVPVVIDDPRAAYPPGGSGTEDMYRQEFADTHGNKADHGYAYHCVNCQGNCAWEVWVKDGKVTRENQSASYPSVHPEIPDFNPRGCNKGAQHSQTMYADDRLMYPMKRTGERGAGKWARISWDEALDTVASKIYETIRTVGPEGNYIHLGAGIISEARGASMKRFGTLLGAVRPYIASYVGDMFPGTSLVYGEGNIGCSFDFMYNTNVQVYWGCNPNTSRIPDAHFVWEGKYNGSKVIVISPEFNSTAIHADLWVPIKAGYDGHLALSIMHEIVQKRLFDEAKVKTFTDLPFLVREDTQHMLRLSDIDVEDAGFDKALAEKFDELAGDDHESHGHEVFLVHNTKTGKLTAMPGCEGSALTTLRLKDRGWDIDPALEGSWTVKLKDGKSVKVSPVYMRMVKELEKFPAAVTQKLTGVHPSMVEILARDIALPEVVSLTIGFSLGKHFNGMLTQRAISSLVALTGRMGRAGGLNTENEWSISGLGGLSGFSGKYKQRFASGMVSEFMLGDQMKEADKHFSEEDIRKATGMSKAEHRAKIEAMLAKSKNDEGVGKGKSYWDTVETFLLVADSRFRRNKGGYREGFLKKAKFFAVAEIRMSETAMWADIVLPCASHYEVWDLRTNPGYHRFANIAQPAKGLKQVGEARNEWAIATDLVHRIEKLAKAQYKKSKNKADLHIPDATHSQTGFRELDELVSTFTLEGKLGTDKQAVEYALTHVNQFRGETLESCYDRGGFLQVNKDGGKSSPLYDDRPYNTFENNFFLQRRFETLSGRLTFYVDHPMWIEAGATVPTATEPLRPARFPLVLMTPHARWSIHSTYKTSAVMLRLQRGEPYVMMNPTTADKRGLRDGEKVVMFNDLGEVRAMCKVMPSIPGDAVFMEHGWEPFMYDNKNGHNSLAGDMLNSLEVSDGWGHLKFGVNWDGNQHAYCGNVDLKRA